MTPHTRDEAALHVLNLVRKRAPKNNHFTKLRGGKDVRDGVLHGAVARLMAPDAVFPESLRRRLKPRHFIGNLSLRPIDPTLWAAWLAVHRNYIEREFWFEKTEARDKLVDRAIDAERQAHIRATLVSSPPADEIDLSKLENLARFTEAGNAFAMEPTREIEQQKQIKDEEAALVARESIEAEELVKLREAVNAYARKLPQKQRRAVALVVFEPSLTGSTIAAKCGVAPSTVSKIRANVEEMAERILTIPPEEGGAVEASPAAVPHDELLTQAADAGEVEGYEIDTTADLSRATFHSDVLDLAATLQAPDVDVDVSEATLRNYARRGGGGRRMYSDVELVTGSRYGGRWGDPAKIAERDQYANKKFSARDMRTLEKKSAEAGFDLNGFLRAIDSFLTARAADSLLADTIVFAQKPSG